MASEQEFSWRRSLAWAATLALHALLLVAMSVPMVSFESPAVAVDQQTTTWVPVDVDVPSPVPVVESAPASDPPQPLSEAQRPRLPLSGSPRRRPRAQAQRDPVPSLDADGASAGLETEAAASTPAASNRPVAPMSRSVAYLDDTARALLPQENLYAAAPPPREGDYYTPGDGSEDDVFYRPRALDPNPSRFAHAWRPRGNLLDDWLGQLVEKTTGKVSVPLNAKFSLVCVASVAGLGGGCAIVRNGGTGVIVQRPPPAPWERSNRVQCRELRAALEAAEEAAQVAYFMDRLSALCSAPDDRAENDEARREAGLREGGSTSSEAETTERD